MPLLRRAGIAPEPAFDDPQTPPAPLRHQRPGSRHHPHAQFRRRDLRRVRRRAARRRRQRRADGVRLSRALCAARSEDRPAAASRSRSRPTWPAATIRAAGAMCASPPNTPKITRKHFAARGVQAECIKLNGAVELAPALGLCRRIVDLVSTGATLKANGLVEIERIADVTSRLIVNRAALKTRHAQIAPLDRADRRCRLGSTRKHPISRRPLPASSRPSARPRRMSTRS